MVKTFRLDEFDYQIEIGKFAKQADGAVWFKQGGTVLLSTVVSSPSTEFPGFLPLTVDYREMFSAAGKIPGGYYKREGRSSEREILISRLTDRALRPLFPEDFFDQIQILSTVYSVDKKHAPDILALLASSIALSISKIPCISPVGVVEVGRIEGNWIINPNYDQMQVSDGRLIIAGTQEGICMVEGATNEISETEFIDIMLKAHEVIKKLVAWQREIQQAVGVAKEEPDTTTYNFEHWYNLARTYLTDDVVKKLYTTDKKTRDMRRKEMEEAFLAAHKQEIEKSGISSSVVQYVFDAQLKEQITELIFKEGRRVDERAFDQIRPISTEVGLLPCAHGSALFNRGLTQALVSVTLGGGQDVQRSENIMSDEENNGSFMLHYNFPPFSVGEVRPMRGPGRREIGHGNLAASAFKYMLPSKEGFPYTIRIVADILSSNGSSSMATACGSTMALMQAGVPIKKMIGGVAMGLLKNKRGDIQVLSDIMGFEDEFGLMDFKVVGTQDGITAIQMDIKYKGGFPRQVFEKALEQARIGRLHILAEMRKVMSAPNPTLSELVPKVITFKIETDKIGAIIGSGGKTIREIIEATGTSIDIEEDGLVKIFGGPEAKMDLAIRWVKTLAGQIVPGEKFTGKIKRIADFGLFVELVPGLDGLLHISNIPKDKQRALAKFYTVGDILPVVVAEYDETSGRISLRILEEKA